MMIFVPCFEITVISPWGRSRAGRISRNGNRLWGAPVVPATTCNGGLLSERLPV